MANAVRHIMAAAANALINDDNDDDFEHVVSRTRQSFRRHQSNRPQIRRGRKSSAYFKRKTLLLRRANSDFYPIKTECDMLTSWGFGFCGESKFDLDWCKIELEEYICQLYPRAPLELVGFKLAKVDRQKKLLILNVENVNELKEEIGQSQLIIIPNRDLPVEPYQRNNVTPTVLEEPQHPMARGRVGARRHILQDSYAATTANAPASLVTPTCDRLMDNASVCTVNENNDIYETIDYSFNDFTVDTVETVKGPIHFVVPTLSADADILEIEINRVNCVFDLFQLYADEAVLQKKLLVSFTNEIGVDGGGLQKEMFNLFFDGIENSFFRGEDCTVPFLPLNRVRKHKNKFIFIGRALSHMVLLTGSVPSKLSQITLSLLGNCNLVINQKVILEEFFLYVNPCERAILTKAVNDFKNLNQKETDILTNIFTSHQFFELPCEEEIKDQIISIASDVLIEKPKQLVDLIRQGAMVEKCEAFWRDCDFATFLDLQKPTQNKVVNCLKTAADLTNEETTVFHYLQMYIRCLDNGSLRQFVFFITGSYQMPDFITVHFNNMCGLARRPMISTCSNSIELPCTYCSYQDLKKDFNNCIFSDEAYVYNNY